MEIDTLFSNIEELAKIGRHQVPGIWKFFLPKDFFLKRFPDECASSCSQCPEVKDSGFRPDYRCCTFQPRISNYMLGFAWADAGSPGAKILDQMLADDFLLPEGLIASPKRWSLFLEDQANDKFGKSDQVLCHFLDKDSGLCQIYQYRNAPCSTFFCRHDQKEKGEVFWDQLMIYINQIEHGLSQWAMTQLGIEPKVYFSQFDDYAKQMELFLPGEIGWPKDVLDRVWGDWRGREKEFYRKAAELIDQNRNQLISIAENIIPIESLKFEKSTLAALPDEWQDAVDESDQDEGKVSSIQSLYKLLKFYHRELFES